MILVTGAAGKTGRAIIRVLMKRDALVRALVHNDDHIHAVNALGVKEVLTGDMRSQDRMDQIFKGVRSVYHIPPNVSPDEFKIGQTMIEAARSAEVEHFVFHSVLHPQIESMPHHWQKMRVEEKIFKSGLAYTILQPAVYMQNILSYWDEILHNGRYAVPYPAQTRLSFVDLLDLAEAAAIVLTESGHEGAIYELCGAVNLSVIETAQMISRCLGKRIQVDQIPIEVWEIQARSKGLGDYQINALIDMFRYYERFGLPGNSTVLECLLNRRATSFNNFIIRTVS